MSAKVFGQRLKQAREAAGLSLRALAKQVGLSHAAIQKYEKGAFPSSDCLIKLAKAIQVPIEHLFRSETVNLGPVSFRKKSSLPIKEIKRIKYQIRDLLERRLELENYYPVIPIQRFDPQKIPNLKLVNDSDLEDIAVKIRSYWKLGLAPIHDLIDVLENHGIRVIEVECNASGFDGTFFHANDEPVIVISSQWPGDRQRFTLAHELGHLLLNQLIPPDLNEEQACNHFAGAFLFPKPSVLQEFGKRRTFIEPQELLLVKQEYGISMGAILHRLLQCKVILASLFKSLQVIFSQRGWRKQEPGEPLPPETPHVFEQMIFHALGEEYISEAKAAELLGIRTDSFRKLRQVNGRGSSRG